MKLYSSCGSYVLSVAAVLLTLTPRPGLAETVLPDVRTLCQPLEIHKGMPNEEACLEELAGAARRDGGVLTLRLSNGRTKIISDARADADRIRQQSRDEAQGFLQGVRSAVAAAATMIKSKHKPEE